MAVLYPIFCLNFFITCTEIISDNKKLFQTNYVASKRFVSFLAASSSSSAYVLSTLSTVSSVYRCAFLLHSSMIFSLTYAPRTTLTTNGIILASVVLISGTPYPSKPSLTMCLIVQTCTRTCSSGISVILVIAIFHMHQSLLI